MKRMLLLATTISLALVLVVGGVAASQQLQEQSTSSQSTTTPEKSGGTVSTESTTAKASFASGSGANFLGVKVSTHGNLVSFESPAGQEAVFEGHEGYAVCSGGGDTIHGHDTGEVEAGFGTPTFSQPNAGAFPLTVTRKSLDGKVQLKQVWNKPDAIEKDVTVTMTLTNLSSSTLISVFLSRSGDFDVGTSQSDQGARTFDSAWLWDDFSTTDSSGVGLMLTALTFGTSHQEYIEQANSWISNTRTRCNPGLTETTPTGVADHTMRMVYALGNLGAGQSKSVKFEYGRM